MKRIITILTAIAPIFCSCNTEKEVLQPQSSATEACLKISLGLDSPSTKAVTPYTGTKDYETQVNTVQILVFDELGMLNIYKDAGTAVSDIEVNINTGNKTVWAVVNGPDVSAVTTESALQATKITLGNHSRDKSIGFIMAGSTSCNLTETGASVNIPVSRFVSRVALKRVTNSLPASYGNILIDHVILINIIGGQNLGGNATITSSSWMHPAGRGNIHYDHIIDGESYDPSASVAFSNDNRSISNGLSYSESTPQTYYCFPNPTTTDAYGWTQGSFTARKSRLVVAAVIGGTTYYYPITIDNPERNKTYTVELTIVGLGATDPDEPINKANIIASVSVEPWVTGTNYEETI